MCVCILITVFGMCGAVVGRVLVTVPVVALCNHVGLFTNIDTWHCYCFGRRVIDAWHIDTFFILSVNFTVSVNFYITHRNIIETDLFTLECYHAAL